MTKTALENAKIQSNERIAAKDREVAAKQAEGRMLQGKAAMAKVEEDKKQNRFNRRMKVVDTALTTSGKVAGTAAKAFFNDGKWYMAYGPLCLQVAAIPLFYPNGQDLLLERLDSNGLTARAPSVMVIDYVDSIGSQKDRNHFNGNPINIIFQRIQTEARKLNSRIGEYEPGDLAQVLLAEVEVYSLLEYVKRAICIAQTFTADRKDFGDSLLVAMGLSNPSLLRDNLPAIKQTLNLCITKANTALFIPADWPYLQRKLWLCRNVFADSDVTTSQLYVFNKVCAGVYDEANAEINFTSITPGAQLQSASALQLAFDSMVKDLLFSSAVTTMIADLRAAYTKSYNMELLDPGSTLPIVYVDEPLMQVENLRMAPISAKRKVTVGDNTYEMATFGTTADDVIPTTLTIQQDTNGFLFQGYDTSKNGIMMGRGLHFVLDAYVRGGYAPASSSQYLKGYYLSFKHNNVTDEDLFVSTRLMPTFSKTSFTANQVGGASSESYVVRVDTCGTEVVSGIKLFTAVTREEWATPAYGIRYIPFHQYELHFSLGNFKTIPDVAEAINDYHLQYTGQFHSFVDAFHSAPIREYLGKGSDQPIMIATIPVSVRNSISTLPTRIIGSQDKLIPLTWDNLDYIHEAADMSVLYISQPVRKF